MRKKSPQPRELFVELGADEHGLPESLYELKTAPQ
jgi:hypothetical protein